MFQYRRGGGTKDDIKALSSHHRLGNAARKIPDIAGVAKIQEYEQQ